MIFNGSISSRDDLSFQKKKVGSIRDNPKLLKIRQRFENASQNPPDLHSVHSESAPSSISCTLPRGARTSVLDELVKCSSRFSDGNETLMKTLHARRHSEGDVGSKSSFSVYSSRSPPKSSLGTKNNGQVNDFSSESISSIYSRYTTSKQNDSKNHIENISGRSNILPEAHTHAEKAAVSGVKDDDTESPAPPIPRRGISPAVRKNVIDHLSLSSSQSSNSGPLEQASNRPKCSPVMKAIQMYEGMSSGEVRKSKLPKGAAVKSSAKKDSVSRHSSVVRRTSRRNSMRKAKLFPSDSNQTNSSSKKVDPEESSAKEDSGLGSSDAEDKTQSVYQTLSSVVQNRDDPYDRLNRVHDFVSRVHKGQISSCAACKALPSSIAQLPQEESSVRKVKCNEVSPHHHPPCICFSCSHSVFSCSMEQSLTEEDTLYSNVCCLNFPDRGDQWRQSRRRPVCERNGRVCVVNCDMEQKHLETHYDNLCDWKSKSKESSEEKSNLSKSVLADSCDSDEGWVDITDSEDEKFVSNDYRFTHLHSHLNDESGILDNLKTYFSVQNASYGIDCLISKCADIDISRCTSTEHLYESIADIDSPNASKSTNEELDSSIESKLLPLKNDTSSENELDSGEWSTESASPIFDESADKNNSQSEKASQDPYAVNMKDQDTAKNNFMKSVLGKKAPSTKRRMSNFFVPWLVVNECNTPPSSHSHKKKGGCYPVQNKVVPAKAKRTQSTPTNSPKIGLSRVKAVSSPSCLEKSKSKSVKSESSSNIFDNLCIPADFSGRTSIASSAYLRAEDLEKPWSVTSNSSPSSSDGQTIEVTVEHTRHRSLSGTSDHSYILFQPVKEEDVPLYQFFERNMKERVSLCCSPSNFSALSTSYTPEVGAADSGMRPQLSVVEQLSPDTKDMKMLWCELPEVKESGILERISAQELKLQEAAFEFIQSQASFIRSLKVLYENFIRAPEFCDQESSSCVLSKHEHDVLFSDILRVKEFGENLLCDLTARWSEGILIPDICDIIHQHVTLPSFSIYIRYCSNRMYQERTLKELKETRLCFLDVLRKLEINPACQGLNLESFLFLPMQHIARLPLLLDNIFRWLSPESSTFSTCKSALESVHKTFMECNEGARKMERLEEMFILNKQLEFKECKALPLISASRWLLKKGELVKLEFDKKTFGRSNRCVRVPVYMFLFNDFLVITKRKSDESYQVVDYCPREKVQAMAVNARDLQYPVVVPNTCRYLIYLTLFQNHQGGAVDMIISCTLLSERTRWIEAIHTIPENKPCEIWEYDCPQVQCVRTYIAQQPDELSLQESDVVTIHRKMNDGWYEGRRLRDGMQGWFPASYTMDIPCSRARASNLRQCYRLLMLSHNKQ